MTSAVQIIRLEHFNIASVLVCLSHLLEEIEQERWTPDFDLLGAVLDYLEQFPEVFHHPKEEDHLFKALAERAPEVEEKLGYVRQEHVKGAEMLAALRRQLEAYRADPSAFAAFRRDAEAYVVFERRHMAREERELLPLALKVLTDEDWRAINTAFGRNEDPMFGRDRKKEFAGLVQRILALAPSPLGFKEQEKLA